MNDLTRKQQNILEHIIAKWNQGHHPTLRELMEHFRFNAIGTVQGHLAALQKKGYIRRSGLARSIEPVISVQTNDNVLQLPIVGRIAAGMPLLAEETIEDYMTVDRGLVNSPEAFLLRVKGTSMLNAGIFDGDLVAVQPQPIVQQGQIAVVLLDGEEATLKRFYRRGKHVVLKPENPTMDPITIDPEKVPVQILGKVVAVLRGHPQI
ncbi:MAG: transcriptional repressor LexA [Candidatus Theseobacter exili]|nr:transcriptional repressor LexA [Candidatus Theseobacter exili]